MTGHIDDFLGTIITTILLQYATYTTTYALTFMRNEFRKGHRIVKLAKTIASLTAITPTSPTQLEWEKTNKIINSISECSTFTSGDSTQVMHTHYSVTHLSEDDATIVFGLRLWNPEQWRNARFVNLLLPFFIKV